MYPTSFTLLERDLTLGESLELTKLAEVRLGMHGKVSVVIKTLRPPPSHTAFKNVSAEIPLEITISDLPTRNSTVRLFVGVVYRTQIS